MSGFEKKAKKLFAKTKEEFNKAKKTYVCKSYKEVIRGFRACTTKEQERALVKKECAHIRDLFRANDSAFRRRNVLKLLFFHMNGYLVDFGQMECLKLCAAPKFRDKRIGYLGLIILLDENQELIVLVSNSVKLDLTKTNDTMINGIALMTLGDISSVDMLRDLIPEIEQHIQNPDPYIRKKAALAATRAVKKLDEGAELFAHYIQDLVNSGSASSIMTGITLLNEVIRKQPEEIPALRQAVVPTLMNVLRSLHNLPAVDANIAILGVNDPFVRVQALQALTVLAKDDSSTEKQVSTLLREFAQIMNPTGSGSVYLEVVRSIFKISTDEATLTEGYNMLANLLSSDDSNYRFVALAEIIKVASRNPSWVKEQEEIVVKCMNEIDPSIRLRAVLVAHSIVDEHNVVELATQVMNFLQTCDAHLKSETCYKINDMTKRFASSQNWRFDTMLQAMEIADDAMTENLINELYSVVSKDANLQPYVAQKVYDMCIKDLKEKITSQWSSTVRRKYRFERFCMYIIGEYGQTIIPSYANMSVITSAIDKILNDRCAELSNSTSNILDEANQMRVNALQALCKILARVGNKISTSDKANATNVINKYRDCLDLSLQQRACEFTALINGHVTISSVLEQLPPFDFKIETEVNISDSTSLIIPDLIDDAGVLVSIQATSKTGTSSFGNDLLSMMLGSDAEAQIVQASGDGDGSDDIFAMLGSGGANTGVKALEGPPLSSTTNQPSNSNALELFSFIGPSGQSNKPMGGASSQAGLGPSVNMSNSGSVNSSSRTGSSFNLDDLYPSANTTTKTTAAKPNTTKKSKGSCVVYNGSDITIEMSFFKDNEVEQNSTRAVAFITNNTSSDITGFKLQLSVPKYISVHLRPASSTTVPAKGKGNVNQEVHFQNSMQNVKPLQMRYRFEYISPHGPKTEQGVVTGIPSNL